MLRILLTALISAIVLAIAPLRAQPASDTANAGGLTAYLGVVPAEIVKGHPPDHPEGTMHGGPPRGAHEYGGFFELPGADLYTIRVTVKRPGSQTPVVLEFRYDHHGQQ